MQGIALALHEEAELFSHPRTLIGHWGDWSGQVTVTFDGMHGGRAEPAMVFQPAHDGLQAVTWNHASWGKVAPPPMKKGGSR